MAKTTSLNQHQLVSVLLVLIGFVIIGKPDLVGVLVGAALIIKGLSDLF